MKKQIALVGMLMIIAPILLGGCNKLTPAKDMAVYPAVLDEKEEGMLQRMGGTDAKLFDCQLGEGIKSYEVSVLRLREDKKWEKTNHAFFGNFENTPNVENLLIQWKSLDQLYINVQSPEGSGGILMDLRKDYVDDAMGMIIESLNERQSIQVNEPMVLQSKGYAQSGSIQGGVIGKLEDALANGRNWDKGYLVVVCFYDKTVEENPRWKNDEVVEAKSTEDKTNKEVANNTQGDEGTKDALNNNGTAKAPDNQGSKENSDNQPVTEDKAKS